MNKAEVTIHLTREQYDELRERILYGSPLDRASTSLQNAVADAELNPLLHPDVTIGAAFKRGNG